MPPVNAQHLNSYEYSADGTTTYRVGINDAPFLFNGKFGVQTEANGLLCMRARYYNPYLCRFINPDPAGFSGGLNWHAYAEGNPVSYRDPNGLGPVGDHYSASWATAHNLMRASGAPLDLTNPFGVPATEHTPGTWQLFGNGLSNTVSAIGQSMGRGLYDLTHLRCSQQEYQRIGDLMYSTARPEVPEATPYVVGALGVPSAAAVTAGGAMFAGADPWLGDIAYHSAHAGGPHQYPHIQIMIRTGESVTRQIRIPLGPGP